MITDRATPSLRRGRTGDPAVEAHGLTKRYGSRLAVDRASFTIPRGCAAVIVGPNGAGKTTTLRMLLGLVRPTSGGARVLGVGVEPKNGGHLHGVGATIEAPAFYPHLTARENLECLATMSRLNPAPGRVAAALEHVGLARRADERFRSLSQGMKQRLALASALIHGTRLLILDEPTNGLDPGGMREILALLKQRRDEGTTIVLSTHLLADVGDWCDYAVVIDRGRVLAADHLDAVVPAPRGIRIEMYGRAEAERAATVLGREAIVEAEGRVLWRCGVPLSEAALRLERAGIAFNSLGYARPSLSDIYAELTGGRSGD